MTSTIGHGQKQQRARQQLSCTACRAGKLKCDRQQPCDQCHKRSREDSCYYLPAPPKKKQNRNTKERIAQLEGLVVQLMNRDGTPGTSSTTPPISDDGSSYKSRVRIEQGQSLTSRSSKESPQSDDSAESAAHDLTYLKVSGDGQSLYRGSAHWEAILDSIAELRDEYDDDENEDENLADGFEEDPQNQNYNRTIIVGVPPPVTRSVLISSLPPKHVADRFLWYWFNSTDPGLPMIHQPTFLVVYDTLWVDSSKVPTMWLALLYFILTLGSKIAKFTITNERGEFVGQNIDPDKFQQLGASALALADYTKPQRYVMEALMTLVSCEYMNLGRAHAIWLMMSCIVRLALRMGYHRDADNFPNISVFDGEMRRRVWTIVFTFDVLHSYQEGMPSMVQQLHSDSKPPSNLLDTDFGPDTQELPQPRPLTELSPISYRVVKNRLSRVFARACDMSNMTQIPDFDEIMKVDKEIDKIYSSMPNGLRFSSMSQAIFDPPNLIFNRFKLELLFHKTRCVLHRRSMFQIDVGSPREKSRQLCVEAAMRILQHHEAIFNAAQDGGPLSSSRFFLASLNSADFLLAAMVLCLELHLISVAPSPVLAGPNQARVDEIRSLLENSHSIFKKPGSHFTDTEKAAKAMEAILRKAPRPSNSSLNETPQTGGDFMSKTSSIFNSGSTPGLPGTFGNIQNSESNVFEPISGMLQGNEDLGSIDWATWDRTVLQYNDPTHFASQYDTNMWSSGLGNFDFTGIPDFNLENTDTNLATPSTLSNWPTRGISSSSAEFIAKNPAKGVPGSGVMPM